METSNILKIENRNGENHFFFLDKGGIRSIQNRSHSFLWTKATYKAYNITNRGPGIPTMACS